MKKMVKNTLLGIMMVITVLILTGCSSESQNVSEINKIEKENYETYRDSGNVCFDYPSDWISMSTEELPIFISPSGNGTSVNMTKEEIASSYSFEEYMEIAVEKVKEELNIEEEIKLEKIMLNGREAYQISYNASSEYAETESEINVRITQTAIKIDSTIYILTAAAVDEYYEGEKETLDTIIASFRYEQ